MKATMVAGVVNKGYVVCVFMSMWLCVHMYACMCRLESNLKCCPSRGVYVCVFMYVWVYVHMCTCMCRLEDSLRWCLSEHCVSSLSIFRPGLSLVWSFLRGLGWLAIEPQGSISLCLPTSGAEHSCHQT